MEMILYAYSGINMWTSALWQQPAPDSATHLKHVSELRPTQHQVYLMQLAGMTFQSHRQLATMPATNNAGSSNVVFQVGAAELML